MGGIALVFSASARAWKMGKRTAKSVLDAGPKEDHDKETSRGAVFTQCQSHRYPLSRRTCFSVAFSRRLYGLMGVEAIGTFPFATISHGARETLVPLWQDADPKRIFNHFRAGSLTSDVG